MSTMETTAPAGWYQHPVNKHPGVQMYWDGEKWRTDLIKTPDMPNLYAHPSSRGPMTAQSLRVERKVSYVRQQRGHSLTLHLLLGVFVLWIPAVYITVSPNHYWHA
jgi:hypothetical protein